MNKPLHRRTLIKGGTLALLLGSADIALGATIVAVRVWPAADYTRVTIESDTALKTTPLFVANPPRLAVDIDGIELNPALRELVGKVRSDDPYITGVRVGQYTPTTVRLVLDLRQMVQPQVFNLQPVSSGGARYQHRLVLDLYPTKVADPLEALIVDRLNGTHTHVPSMTATPSVSAATLGTSSDPLADLLASQNRQPQPLGAPAANASGTSAPFTSAASVSNNADKGSERFIIVALDPGHGGEDPGAIGPRGTKEKDVVLQIAHRMREQIGRAHV